MALKAELTEMLPFAPIVSLLIEMDKRTGFLDCFTWASGKHARSPELRRDLIAVLITLSTNLGLTKVTGACGIAYDRPADSCLGFLLVLGKLVASRVGTRRTRLDNGDGDDRTECGGGSGGGERDA